MLQPIGFRESTARVRARRERRRAEILRAALTAFRDRGYHGTTLDDIAAQVGVRNTALYHYFPDKQSILLACHRDSIREHVRVVTEALGGSPVAFEVASLPPERQDEIVAARDRYERELREILSLGMREGAFRSTDPKLAAFVILGALNGIARWYRPGGDHDATSLGEAFADHLVGGLLATAPATRKGVRA